ncbi:hypothetical protein [Veronia nyctiphanis]|nr:hypothetical protein [Veronia nyctiphanis]
MKPQVVQRAPSAGNTSVKLVPKELQTKVSLQFLQHIFREALEDGDFSFIEGRWLEIHITDIDTRSVIGYKERRFVPPSDNPSPDISAKMVLSGIGLGKRRSKHCSFIDVCKLKVTQSVG